MKLRTLSAASVLFAILMLAYASQTRADEEIVDMPMASAGCASCGAAPDYMAAPACGCAQPCGCHWWNRVNLDPLGLFHCKECCPQPCGCQPACGCSAPCGCEARCCHRPAINLDPLGLFHCNKGCAPACGCGCGEGIESTGVISPPCGCGIR